MYISINHCAVVKVLTSTEKPSKEEGESGVGSEGEESGKGVQCLVNIDSETETESEAPGISHPTQREILV